MNKQKSVFVFWSGGIDSSYMINKLLVEGYKVTAGYFNLGNNERQAERELKAIDNMLPYFNKYPFNYTGKLADITLYQKTNIFNLSYPPIFMLAPYFVGSVDELAIGYVMNDDACSFIKDIETIYYSLQGICSEPLPKLIFPLLKEKKEYFYNGLHDIIKENAVWCENDNTIGCTCPSCKRMRSIGIENNNKYASDIVCCEDVMKESYSDNMLINLGVR